MDDCGVVEGGVFDGWWCRDLGAAMCGGTKTVVWEFVGWQETKFGKLFGGHIFFTEGRNTTDRVEHFDAPGFAAAFGSCQPTH